MIAFDLYAIAVGTLIGAIYVAAVIIRERIERRRRFQKTMLRQDICPFCGADLEGMRKWK